MATVFLSPIGNGAQYLGVSLTLLAGGTLTTYQAGTSTPLATYTTNLGNVTNSNPITLDSSGRPPQEIWLVQGSSYKFVLADSLGSIIATYDNISGINDPTAVNLAMQVVGCTPLTSIAGTNSITANSTGTFTSYTTGQSFAFVAAGTNTGPVTLAITTTVGIGAAPVQTPLGAALIGQEIQSGQLVHVYWSGSAFRMFDFGGTRLTGSITGPDQFGWRNRLINGSCAVAQGSVPNLSTASQYGQVDMATAWCSTGGVSAGTIAQSLVSSAGTTGRALSVVSATLTGSSVVSWRYRVESLDAVGLKNQTATFQIKVWHNVGSSINYTVVIRKPTASDNYSGVTVIGTSSATSVATSTATTLTYTLALGDCSNGLEIEVQAACGAVSTKTFDFTEWQLEKGTQASAFEFRPFADELLACQRYFEKSFALTTAPANNVGIAGATFITGTPGAAFPITSVDIGVGSFKVVKRIAPVMIGYSPTNNSSSPLNYTTGADFGISTINNLSQVGFKLFARTDGGYTLGNLIAFHWTADARL